MMGHRTSMIITRKTVEWKEKNTIEIKGLVVKWQRALVTPFRNASALEADPLQLVSKVFTGK